MASITTRYFRKSTRPSVTPPSVDAPVDRFPPEPCANRGQRQGAHPCATLADAVVWKLQRLCLSCQSMRELGSRVVFLTIDPIKRPSAAPFLHKLGMIPSAPETCRNSGNLSPKGNVVIAIPTARGSTTLGSRHLVTPDAAGHVDLGGRFGLRVVEPADPFVLSSSPMRNQ